MRVQIAKLAEASQNFGFLLGHEPLLVFYGAGAESYVYADPNAALVKARQFGEVLATTMVAQTGVRTRGAHQVDRVSALAKAGLLDPRIKKAFDTVRRTGNEAVHGHYAEVRVAVTVVGHCFELGVWFHRFKTGDRAVLAFVPPPEPDASASPAASGADAAQLEALRGELATYRNRLAEAKLSLDGRRTRLEAERAARADAEAALARALADTEFLQTTVAALNSEIAALAAVGEPAASGVPEQPRATGTGDASQYLVAPGVFKVSAGGSAAVPARRDSAAQRESFIERALDAAREPRTEREVRAEVDRMLAAAGWSVQDAAAVNLYAAEGVAVREARTASGPADYLLYVGRMPVGVIEAKREGTALTQVEPQSARYASTLTARQQLAAWRTPLPFRYETTAAETQFTNDLDPTPRARRVFSFHRPQTLARWMREADDDPGHPTLRARLGDLPERVPLNPANLRPAQVEAVLGLEESLAAGRPRALIQMATGAGKTFAAVTSTYRLLGGAKAHRILFLVDRNNLGRQARDEFAVYRTPDDGRKFTELYNVQLLAGAGMLDSSQVVISTIQRLYAVLRGREVPGPDVDDPMFEDGEEAEPAEVAYSAALPPETFDLIVVDECHRSIYGRWRAVLEYFDAFQVGLTATPTKQTLGFFQRNLVSEYTYPQAVADAVNVDFTVYRIRTRHGEHGDTIDAGIVVPRRDRRTRVQRYEELDDDFVWGPEQLGRSVISYGNLDLVLTTFRDRLFTEIFPGRREVPKTLIFARDDNHADEVVRKVREVFGRGNDFAAKITYSVQRTDELLASFRNSPELRVVVTVDMISTGTDVRALECLLFLRNPKSWVAFEQMKGRGARTIDPNEFQRVTADAVTKDRFVLVDAVGVVDGQRVDAGPLERHTDKQISLERLLRRTGTLEITAAEASTLASRLSRLNQQITADERAELERLAGQPLTAIVRSLTRAADADELARAEAAGPAGVRALVEQAVAPLAAHPELRARLLEIRRAHDITYDEVNADELISAEGVDPKVLAQQTVDSWRGFLEQHRDEIALIEAGYERGTGQRTVYAELQDLARRIARPPHGWTPEGLWRAYERLELAAARPGVRYGPLDLIGLIRYELGVEEHPRPHRVVVEERFAGWIARQRQAAREFTPGELWWLERIKNIVANEAAFEDGELDEPPFTERGGTDGFLAAFGPDRAAAILTDLRQDLVA